MMEVNDLRLRQALSATESGSQDLDIHLEAKKKEKPAPVPKIYILGAHADVMAIAKAGQVDPDSGPHKVVEIRQSIVKEGFHQLHGLKGLTIYVMPGCPLRAKEMEELRTYCRGRGHRLHFVSKGAYQAVLAEVRDAKTPASLE